MIREVEVGKRYLSFSGRPFQVTGVMQYALNCSVRAVRYINLLPTDDAIAGTEWYLEEDVFLRSFRYDNSETYDLRVE
ncbi:hypothetical protein NFI00_000212 [Salmonella enterica]|nr:hypothetical protein [Salmonella enterica]